MKKAKVIVLSFLLLLGASGTASASETDNLRGPNCVYPCMDM